ncbi:hypothetical protein [uncultured Brevundimonas sp.]|uniref:SLOG domain-containing protein n=1 Tax=uncultured Brevundimonas sp. TaxID=213418 RepID=UPI00260B439C|nr:hypothetical protein [uncultured Brevundimonas sp.]
MSDAIFLSAGVPDPRRSPEDAKTANTVAIQAAVSALLFVTLGRRPLVWGGQPGITPMVWVVAEDMGLDYGRWVKLYQSRFFQDEYPEDNIRFQNVTFIDSVNDSRDDSLLAMRKAMFQQNQFSAAIFIGGMKGIVDEYELFQKLQPQATILPIASTGGATLEVAKRLGTSDPDLFDNLDYVSLFHRRLGIQEQERRYIRPDEQPADIADRLWKPDPRRPA